MKLVRRRLLCAAAGAAALHAVCRAALAQNYPTRPIRLIVTTAAGGSADLIARRIGRWLSERLGQPIVVESRSGGGTHIGTDIALRAAPDGYTLLLAISANAINAVVYDNLPFNFGRDIAPVASIASIPLVMETNPSVPANTLPEFIAYANVNPGKTNIASGGNASPLHVAGELFKIMAGGDMVRVADRGVAHALPDLISGQGQGLFR